MGCVLGVPTAARNALERPARSAAQVLLDFGLAEELTPRVRKHFLSFLHAICAGNGAAGARHMLAFGVVQVRFRC